MRIQSLAGAWEFRQACTEEWLPANVPGGVWKNIRLEGNEGARIAEVRSASSAPRASLLNPCRLAILSDGRMTEQADNRQMRLAK